jgi:hypothetical protein
MKLYIEYKPLPPYFGETRLLSVYEEDLTLLKLKAPPLKTSRDIERRLKTHSLCIPSNLDVPLSGFGLPCLRQFVPVGDGDCSSCQRRTKSSGPNHLHLSILTVTV